MAAIANRLLTILLGVTLLLATSSRAAAERLRFHYVPAPSPTDGVTRLQPADAGGQPVIAWRRGCPQHYDYPTGCCEITFTHPCTGQCIKLPLCLPAGTPRIEHVWSRIVYNYGSYTVEVRFLPDGSVDVIYNSGLLRAL
jgi:hypothetical protein